MGHCEESHDFFIRTTKQSSEEIASLRDRRSVAPCPTASVRRGICSASISVVSFRLFAALRVTARCHSEGVTVFGDDRPKVPLGRIRNAQSHNSLPQILRCAHNRPRLRIAMTITLSSTQAIAPEYTAHQPHSSLYTAMGSPSRRSSSTPDTAHRNRQPRSDMLSAASPSDQLLN